MNSEEINVGDFVEVVNCGRTYDTYKAWAEKYNLSKFAIGSNTKNGEQYKVIVKAPHQTWQSDTLLGIEDTSGKQFIIGIEGVKKIETAKASLPEKFKFFVDYQTPDNTYNAELRECEYFVSWMEDGAKREIDYETSVVESLIKEGHWTIIEEHLNGVDSSGKPLNFTKEMLKPFMRVKTKNGQMWIVVLNQHKLDFDCDFALCANEEWIEFFAGVGDASSSEHCSFAGTNNGYEAVEVYDMPEYNIDMLVYGAAGKLLWKANEEIPNVENNVPQENNFEQRLKHIEETLAGVNAKITELQLERNMNVSVHISNEVDAEEIQRELVDKLRRYRLI